MSITYLVVDGGNRIAGIFTLAHKAVQLLDTELTGTELMDMTIVILKEIQRQISGRLSIYFWRSFTVSVFM
ncbi:hypothetical protein [Frisingicoccus sp.]|uniref:hypothetical protein n=1 Tax=Frisingicoccus sp. TaxID=1918627 RepID=UPI003AB890BA